MAITKVAVAGVSDCSHDCENINIKVEQGTGNLGPAIVNALVEAGFQVTVLSRSASGQLDSRVKVTVVDYESLSSLTSALGGQDAVVSTLGVGVVPRDIHLRLIEAAHTAGVGRFIPSEYGCDTSHPLTSQLPVFGDKIAVIQNLKEVVEKDNAFTYTAVITGPFFDWSLKNGTFINFAGPTTSIYDGGNVPFSTTTLRGIGRAVAGVLKHPDQTKNCHVYVSEADVMQNQLLSFIDREKKPGPEAVQTDDLEKQAYEAVKQPTPDLSTFALNLIRRAIFGGKFGSLFATVDNDLLGVNRLSEPEIAGLVRQYV